MSGRGSTVRLLCGPAKHIVMRCLAIAMREAETIAVWNVEAKTRSTRPKRVTRTSTTVSGHYSKSANVYANRCNYTCNLISSKNPLTTLASDKSKDGD